MMAHAENDIEPKGSRWRVIAWGSAAGLLTVPAVAMQFTNEVNWTVSDFIIMGFMLTVVGLMIELTIRASGSISYRIGASVAVLAGFLLVWVNGAVGFLGDEGNPANLLFFGVLAAAVIGAFIGGFKAAGMAYAMLAALAVQIGIAVIAFAYNLGSPGYDGIYEIVMGTSLFSMLWLIAAGLFRKAAREQEA